MNDVTTGSAAKNALTADTLKAAASLRSEIQRLGNGSSLDKLRELSQRLETLGQKQLVSPNGRAGIASRTANASASIKGTNRSDLLIGTPLADEIKGLGGNDTVLGLGGNDQIYGGNGDDLIVAGSGNDRVFGGRGDDQVLGGSGDDIIRGNDGVDVLFGEAGNDDLNGGNGNDRLFGDAGNDKVVGGAGNDILNGGDGSDRLFGQDGNDRLFGGNGADALRGGEGNDDLNGNAGDDALYGNNGNDRLFGGGGDDRAFGGNGDDQFIGSDGNDRLSGGSGSDTADYSGLQGKVTFRADVTVLLEDPDQPPNGPFTRKITYSVTKPEGDDVISGIETIIGAQGQANSIDFSDTAPYAATYSVPGRSSVPYSIPIAAPRLNVDLSKNQLNAGGRDYKIVGFRDVVGSFGNDVITGDDQDNVLQSGRDFSVPNGFRGIYDGIESVPKNDRDTLSGGKGNDTLISNGQDILTGGSGADTFSFRSGGLLYTISEPGQFPVIKTEFPAGASQITDFNRAEGDKIEIVAGFPTVNSFGFFNPSFRGGVLESDQFAVVEDGAVPDSAIFTYSRGTGELSFTGIGVDSFDRVFKTFSVANLGAGFDLQASDIIIAPPVA